MTVALGRAPSVPMLRLRALAHGRDNNFQLIRLLAASFVVLFHRYAPTGRWTHEPLWRLIQAQFDRQCP